MISNTHLNIPKVLYNPDMSKLILSYLPEYQPVMNKEYLIKKLSKYKIPDNIYNNMLIAINIDINQDEGKCFISEMLTLIEGITTIVGYCDIRYIKTILIKYMYTVVCDLIANKSTYFIVVNYTLVKGYVDKYEQIEYEDIQLLPKQLKNILFNHEMSLRPIAYFLGTIGKCEPEPEITYWKPRRSERLKNKKYINYEE